MENWKQTTIVGLVAIISILCVFQAGCSEPCDCSDVVGTAVMAEKEQANKVIVAQTKALNSASDDIKKMAELAKAGTECLGREDARKMVKESEKETEAKACDADLIGMDITCPSDPQKAFPFRTLTMEERLSANYSNSLVYWNYEYYLEKALECPPERSWSKYTREQVQIMRDCLKKQYLSSHKAVVLYTKPLGMHFAAFREEECGYEPALRVVLDIMRDVDRDQGASLSDFGVTLAQLTAAYQLRFKEALEFYEARVEACKDGKGKDMFRDRDGVLLDQLCDLVVDGNLYADYPDPLKGMSRDEVAKRLNCRVED